MGVPTLKLKILATTLSGCLMGMSACRFRHVTLIEPGFRLQPGLRRE